VEKLCSLGIVFFVLMKSNLDFAIFKLCPGQLDYSNQNGRPKKKQLEQRKVNSPSKFCFICTILLSDYMY
jgi:hypothetical protein